MWPNFFSVERKGLATPSEQKFAQLGFRHMKFYLDTAKQAEIGSRRRARFLALATGFMFAAGWVDHLVAAHCPATFWDDAYGVRGCFLNEASLCYDYEKHHNTLLSQHSFDGCLRINHSLPLFLHWGDLTNANANADRTLVNLARLSSEPSPDASTLAMASLEWPWMLYLLGRTKDAASFMVWHKIDYNNAKMTVRGVCERTRLFGSMADGAMFDEESIVANLQSLWMLVGNDDMAISADEFIASLPEPDPLARHGVWKNPDGKAVLHATHFLALTSLVWPALALEKLAVSEEKAASASMAYAAKALEKDHTIGGGTPGHLRTLVHRCCGRILSKRGKMAEARVAFEAAEAEATEREYWMLAALARRDLVEHVIEPSGALGSEGRDGHLAPLVARLVAPKDELATLLGQGFVG